MIIRMAASHWVTPDGRGLRFFRQDEYYLVSSGFGLELLRRGVALLPTSGDIMNRYPPRVLTLITPPVCEPVTLAEAKLFLRVDGSEEDTMICDLIAASREKIEVWLRKSLLSQRWQLQQQYMPGQTVKLPLGPVQEIVSVTLTRLGQMMTLATEQYRLIPEAAELEFLLAADADRLSIIYECGYNDTSKIPAPIRQAVLHAVAYHYHHREEAGDLSAQVKRMLADFREMRV